MVPRVAVTPCTNQSPQQIQTLSQISHRDRFGQTFKSVTVTDSGLAQISHCDRFGRSHKSVAVTGSDVRPLLPNTPGQFPVPTTTNDKWTLFAFLFDFSSSSQFSSTHCLKAFPAFGVVHWKARVVSVAATESVRLSPRQKAQGLRQMVIFDDSARASRTLIS